MEEITDILKTHAINIIAIEPFRKYSFEQCNGLGEKFDVPTPATIKFSFQDFHYHEVMPDQPFAIMEGGRQVGEGTIISIEK